MTHYLKFENCQDEADKYGVAFKPSNCGNFVEVFDVYAEHYTGILPDYKKTLTTKAARALWVQMLAEVCPWGRQAYTRSITRP